jgi:hypothetical protein
MLVTTIAPEVRAEVFARAEREGVPVSRVVERALASWLGLDATETLEGAAHPVPRSA